LTATANPGTINYKWTKWAKEDSDQAKLFGLGTTELHREMKVVRLIIKFQLNFKAQFDYIGQLQPQHAD